MRGVTISVDMTRGIEKRVLEAIDVDMMLEYLCELISLQSLGGEETPCQESVVSQMERCGLEVDIWELNFNKLQNHTAFSMEVDRKSGLGIVGSMGQGIGGRSLILNGHVDVVPIGDLANWNKPPWEGTIAEGQVYGRGAADMKGGLCCALFAAKALHDAGVRLRGRMMIESVIGEEDGGVGTLATLLRGYKAEGAIVLEPTKLSIAPAQTGAFNFRITIPGKAAHGCLRQEGVDPIEKFIIVFEELKDLERDRNRNISDPLYKHYPMPYSLCIGNVRAGIWASTVAENLVCEGRYGVAADEDPTAARRALEQAVARAAKTDPWLRDHHPVIEWWGGQFQPARIHENHPIIRTLSSAYEDASGRGPRIEGMTYGADMGLLVRVGHIPTVLFGPGDIRNAHRPDEHVNIGELRAAVRTLVLMILRFCESG